MNDADFIQEMQQGLPPINPPSGLSTVDCTDLLLANTDIEINHHEAIHGICVEETTCSADALAALDHEISILAGRMSTADLRRRWPDAEREHAVLVRKRQQHAAAIGER